MTPTKAGCGDALPSRHNGGAVIALAGSLLVCHAARQQTPDTAFCCVTYRPQPATGTRERPLDPAAPADYPVYIDRLSRINVAGRGY